METINITTLRQDIFNVTEEVVKFNTAYSITSKEGEAVLISRKEYETLKEMEFFNNRPELKQELLESLNAPDSEFIGEDELEW